MLARPFRGHVGVGEEVLDRLEGPDGRAVLAARAGIVARDRHRAPHHSDEVGAGDSQPETVPPREVVGTERVGYPLDRRHRRTRRTARHRPGQVDTRRPTVHGDRADRVLVALAEQHQRGRRRVCVKRYDPRAKRAAERDGGLGQIRAERDGL
jgi:hypothetical protein